MDSLEVPWCSCFLRVKAFQQRVALGMMSNLTGDLAESENSRARKIRNSWTRRVNFH